MTEAGKVVHIVIFNNCQKFSKQWELEAGSGMNTYLLVQGQFSSQKR
jgi:5-keto 4-deoxyuronate isomerase